MRPARHGRSRGQALVEFSLILVPFLITLLGIADLGRGIYTNNGVAQAAREIARSTSVHLCDPANCTLGNSPQTLAVIATQKNLVPGLSAPAASISIVCTNVTDTPLIGSGCPSGQFVRVVVRVPFSVLTPLLNMVAPTTLNSSAHIEVP
jgi:Flp pilus assembly protein TadG